MNAGAPMAGSAVPRDGNMNYETLSWDSDFFGMSVARIVAPDLNGDELKKSISRLRQEGVNLVYWPSTRRREAAEKKCYCIHQLEQGGKDPGRCEAAPA